MPANTSPDNIVYPVSTDAVAPLESVFATLAISIQNALNKHPFATADLASLAAITGMAAGDLAEVIEGGAIFRYSGTGWVQATAATFGSASARDTAYAKASGAFRVAQAEAIVTADNISYIYTGSAWVPSRTLTPVSFTPVASAGFSLGNGVVNFAQYTISGGVYLAEVQITLGSTTTIGGPTFNYPVLPATSYTQFAIMGTAWGRDASTGSSYPMLLTHRPTGVTLETTNVGATYPQVTGTSSTIPFAWATTDVLFMRWQWI